MPFDNSSHFVVNEASFTNIVNNRIADIHFLYQHAARGASYDSKDKFDKPKCDPKTRVKLLGDIHEWIKVPEKETGIMVVHGPAGAGKSCIARSACEEAASKGLLGASFFFWRGSSSRNNESQFVTTLAYQLAQGNKKLCRYILSEISQNPHIIEMPPEVQLRKLIIEPCAKMPRGKLSARVIVIDGLDECMGEETQIGILQMLAKAVRHEGFPLAFFVTCRPELHIQEALDSKELIFATNVISLNHVSGVSQDIRTVLESGFIRILNNPRFKRAMKSLPRPWPTSDNIDQLVQRSSGQFIYTATVLKFVSDPDSSPVSQLEIVLGIKENEGSSSESPFANLDLLYHQIMSGVKHPELTRKVLSCVLAVKDLSRRKIITVRRKKQEKLMFSPDITRAVLHNQNRLLLVVEHLLELPVGGAYSALNQLHSLVSLKMGSESTRRHLEIGFYHKSFEDYLTTKKRSTTFHVNIKEVHYELAQSCLQFMGLPKYETESQHVAWLYSCFQWAAHRKFADRSVDIESHDAALKRFISASTHYLNIPYLNRALQVLGLSDGRTGPWSVFLDNIQKFELLPLESIAHALKDAGRTMRHGATVHAQKESTESAIFNKLYTYPAWLKFLQSYRDDARGIKLFALAHYLFGGPLKRFIESETCTMLSALGLVSDESERSSIASQYKAVIQQVDILMPDSWELKRFLMTNESSDTFQWTSGVISDVYAAMISTGLWRNHMWGILCSDNGVEFTASSSMLSCFKSEALEYHDNIELNRTLGWGIEKQLFDWIYKKINGPKEDVIEAWERAFDRARSSFPDNFKNNKGEIIPRK